MPCGLDPCFKQMRHKRVRQVSSLLAAFLSICCYLACVSMRRTAGKSMISTVRKADAVSHPARRESRNFLSHYGPLREREKRLSTSFGFGD